jgi:argininosuccinate lyase
MTAKTGKKRPSGKVRTKSSRKSQDKVWGGRFTMPTDAFVERFTQSVTYDQRLAHYDIMGSMAHACMLARVGVLPQRECNSIIAGLQLIELDIQQNKFTWDVALEDVHMNIEAALIARIGNAGKKLHTARSRNDQVATDMRLYLRDEVRHIRRLLAEVMTRLLDVAGREAQTIMPGFTHLQTAQPITFGHHLMAWFEMLYRDIERLGDCRKRINVMPLGAGALAGTSYPIDRAFTARLLGFSAPAENSVDAVSDRDFVIEFCACASMIMMHLSRFSEELILWLSQQFAFIELDDAWCTGSSIMPQKKNPDIPELVRGKTGRVYGHLLAMLTLMKAQPLAYNRDNQEDKLAVFDTIDTVKACLQAYAGMIPTIKVNAKNMEMAARRGYATATDLADYLVRKQVPFRDAHAIVGRVVQYAVKRDKDLSQLTLKELKQFSAKIGKDVFACLTLQGSVAARNHTGGTAPAQVRQAIKRGLKRLQDIMHEDRN